MCSRTPLQLGLEFRWAHEPPSSERTTSVKLPRLHVGDGHREGVGDGMGLNIRYVGTGGQLPTVDAYVQHLETQGWSLR